MQGYEPLPIERDALRAKEIGAIVAIVTIVAIVAIGSYRAT